MECALDKNELLTLVSKQLNNFFNVNDKEKASLKFNLDKALSRTEFCFDNTQNKYYSKEGKTYFNPFHSGQYSIFLYYLSNTIYKYGEKNTLPDKVYYLNKALNSCDLFYEVELPDIFMLDHPVGSVMGRAKYENYFSFRQNCTVGMNKDKYPTIGKNVKMFSNSMIIGNSLIGKNVILSANSYVKDENIPDDTIVFGKSPNLVLKNQSYHK